VFVDCFLEKKSWGSWGITGPQCSLMPNDIQSIWHKAKERKAISSLIGANPMNIFTPLDNLTNLSKFTN
jgi:hypothetical protein